MRLTRNFFAREFTRVAGAVSLSAMVLVFGGCSFSIDLAGDFDSRETIKKGDTEAIERLEEMDLGIWVNANYVISQGSSGPMVEESNARGVSIATRRSSKDKQFGRDEVRKSGAWELVCGFDGLNSLSLEGIDLDAEDLSALKSLPKLETIYLEDVPVGDELLDVLVQCPKLRKLELKNVGLTAEGISRLSELTESSEEEGIEFQPFLKRVVDLSISDMPIGDSLFDLLEGNQGLTTLSLENLGVTDEGLKRLSQLKQLESLSVIELAVTGEFLESLQGNKALKRLYLDSTDLEPGNLQQLKSLAVTDLNLKGKPSQLIEPIMDNKKVRNVSIIVEEYPDELDEELIEQFNSLRRGRKATARQPGSCIERAITVEEVEEEYVPEENPTPESVDAA